MSAILRFLRFGGRFKFFGDTVTAGPRIYVWESKNIISEDGETGTQSRKNHINVDFAGPDAKLSAAAVPSNLRPAESETFVSASIVHGSTDAPEPMQVSENLRIEENDEVEPIKFDFAALLFRALQHNARKFVSVCQFSRG